MSNLLTFNLTKDELIKNIYGQYTASLISNLAENLHWFEIGQDGVIELYLDNHMMQTFRACEAYFMEAFIKKCGSSHQVWFLSLGVAVHKMVEIYYLTRNKPGFTLENWAKGNGVHIWNALNMDQFKELDEYKNLGGLIGFLGLLVEYAAYFTHDNERFRVVGTELYFGKGKEVLLNKIDPVPMYDECGQYPFRLYLAGKIDLLMDDGEAICPMDHKTFKNFMGKNPQLSYELNDGLTGYVFAARKLVQKFNAENSDGQKIERKLANKIWMNYIQISRVGKDKTSADRFKRMPLYKTDQQLEDYRQRQMRTGQNILSLLLNRPNIEAKFNPTYNTNMCSNWMHRECPFKQVHRLDSNSHDLILKSNFVTKEWKPEEPSEIDKLVSS